MEEKVCKNCEKKFVLDSEDLEFYARMEVPSPTWCPDCRFLRRLTWRNERSLHRQRCGLCGKDMISTTHPASPFTVYCNTCWWGDSWDGMEYGMEYDFSRPFFDQYKELLEKVPMINMWGFSNTNTDYANYTGYSKNVYLSSSVVYGENVYYSYSVDYSRDIYDAFIAEQSELLFECVDVSHAHSSAFLFKSEQCISVQI